MKHLDQVLECIQENNLSPAAMIKLFYLYLFPSQKTEVNMLLFIADNLACFPFQTQEEPLFIMHHIDITLSVSGSNLLQSFKEVSSCSFASLF